MTPAIFCGGLFRQRVRPKPEQPFGNTEELKPMTTDTCQSDRLAAIDVACEQVRRKLWPLCDECRCDRSREARILSTAGLVHGDGDGSFTVSLSIAFDADADPRTAVYAWLRQLMEAVA